MPVFEFVALDTSRSKKRGLWTARSARQARDELRADGWTIVSIKEHASYKEHESYEGGHKQARGHKQASSSHREPDHNNKSHRDTGYGHNIKRGHRAENSTSWHPQSNSGPRKSRSTFESQLNQFVSELATMLSVNISILDALDTQVAQSQGRFQDALLIVRDEVATGGSLADAMKKRADVFDFLTISMISVGEKSGNLGSVLMRLSEFQQNASRFKNKVVSALLYPGVVTLVAFAVALFLMTYVVPNLLNDLMASGRQLPWPTVALKAVSDSLLKFGWVYGIFLAAIGAGLWVLLRTEWGQRTKCRLILAIPYLGRVALMQDLSRLSLVISTLMRTGIPFLAATSIAARTIKNVLLFEQLKKACRALESGKDIGEGLGAQSIFPPLFVHVVSVGQTSGRLEEMLEKIALDYDQQVTYTSSRFTLLLEPVLILGLSVFIGFLLFATMLPILEAGNIQ